MTIAAKHIVLVWVPLLNLHSYARSWSQNAARTPPTPHINLVQLAVHALNRSNHANPAAYLRARSSHISAEAAAWIMCCTRPWSRRVRFLPVPCPRCSHLACNLSGLRSILQPSLRALLDDASGVSPRHSPPPHLDECEHVCRPSRGKQLPALPRL